jgi:phosphoketolase
VLPILHLNGYKIANPTVLSRIPDEELEPLLRGYGYTVHTVEGDDPDLVHQQMAATAGHVRQLMTDKRITCRAYTREQGEDAPEIRDWSWPNQLADRSPE